MSRILFGLLQRAGTMFNGFALALIGNRGENQRTQT
jgi:hypothetical protein